LWLTVAQVYYFTHTAKLKLTACLPPSLRLYNMTGAIRLHITTCVGSTLILFADVARAR